MHHAIVEQVLEYPDAYLIVQQIQAAFPEERPKREAFLTGPFTPPTTISPCLTAFLAGQNSCWFARLKPDHSASTP